MAMFPSVQTPPCERCGLPIVEAHYPDGRCPRPPRRSLRRRVTLGVGGLAGLITFAVAAIVLAGLLRPPVVIPTPRLPNSLQNVEVGAARPGLQACELFYKWEVTHDTNLLSRAIADARSLRVPWQSNVRVITDLKRLRIWIREEGSASSPGQPVRQNLKHPWSSSPVGRNYYEYAIQRDCNKYGAGLTLPYWSEFRKDAARESKAAAHL
jgi:hypothetical protein